MTCQISIGSSRMFIFLTCHTHLSCMCFSRARHQAADRVSPKGGPERIKREGKFIGFIKRTLDCSYYSSSSSSSSSLGFADSMR